MADPSKSVEVDASEAIAVLGRLPAAVFKRTRGALEKSGQEFDREMQKRNRRGGGGTQRRTGRLARSIGYKVTGDSLDDLQVQLFSSGVSYARLQEFGGTVRPRAPRKFLTVPMPDNLTGAGVPRYPSAADLRATQPGKTFVFRKDGKLYIGYQPSPKAKLRVLWKLVRSVTVPARFGFHETWKALEPSRTARNEKALEAAIADAVGGAAKS
jgi:hypothetical protein